jgi:hypothetical protein
MKRKGKKVVMPDFSCIYHGQKDCICPCTANGYRFVDPTLISRKALITRKAEAWPS